MKSRKHLVSRVFFTMLFATDDSNGVALTPNRFAGTSHNTNSAAGGGAAAGGQTQAGSNGNGMNTLSQPTRHGLGPGILHGGNDRGPFQLEEEDEGEDYDDELEEDPDDLLDKREKLLDSDVIPYHKKPGFCMSH